jgi:hypothetical protein
VSLFRLDERRWCDGQAGDAVSTSAIRVEDHAVVGGNVDDGGQVKAATASRRASDVATSPGIESWWGPGRMAAPGSGTVVRCKP